jgi:hypothetical protein
MKLFLKAAGLMLVLSSMAGIAQATPPIPTPEIDPGSMVSALTLLTGGLLVLNGRRRKA